MGNCLKSQNSDDISLLRGSDAPDQNHAHGHGPGPEPPQPVGPPPPYQEAEVMPVYYPSPNVSRPASQLTEDEQIKIAKRLGLISNLPMGVYDGSCKKAKECVICMCEFSMGDMLRFLPCMHVYHKDCIDDWMMRSFTCPSCMEPVDAALLSTYETS